MSGTNTPIKKTFTLSKEEVFRFNIQTNRISGNINLFLYVLGYIFLLQAIIAIFTLNFFNLFFSLFLYLFLVSSRVGAHINMLKYKFGGRNLWTIENTVNLSEKEISVKTDKSSSALSWDLFSFFTLDNEFVILYINRFQLLVFSKKHFDKEEWAKLIALVKSKIETQRKFVGIKDHLIALGLATAITFLFHGGLMLFVFILSLTS